MTDTLHAAAVDAPELHETIKFARSLPQGSPVAVVLQHLAEALLRGADVTFLETGRELTPNQAADLLKVSRPHLIKLMDRGLLVYRMVGTNRRIAMQDLLDYIDRHERANAHVNELLGTREHGLQLIQDKGAELTQTDLDELSALTI